MVCRNLSAFADAPRAGSAKQNPLDGLFVCVHIRCTPCRQRKAKYNDFLPRQTFRRCTPCRQRKAKFIILTLSNIFISDAPRAGSAKQNNNVPPDGPLTTGRHFFTFHPSRIPTALPTSSATMYNPVPIFLTDPALRSRISPTVPMLSVTGRPRGFSWCGGSPWE